MSSVKFPEKGEGSRAPDLLQVVRELKPPLDTPFRNILCLCGERGRGKDYLTQRLIERYGAVRLSFSDELRVLAKQIYPWFDPWDDSLKEVVYPAPENVNGLTGRDILLNVGLVRNVDPAFFVKRFIQNQLPQALADPNRLFVITDFRTPDEYTDFLAPNSVPTLKITRDVSTTPHPFEEWIRKFNADSSFHNDPEAALNEADFIQTVNAIKRSGVLYFEDKNNVERKHLPE